MVYSAEQRVRVQTVQRCRQQRAKLADQRRILKAKLFPRKEFSGGALGERPYYWKPKQGGPVLCRPEHGHHCDGYHNTAQVCGHTDPRDIIKLWQKWQSHFLFKIAYPPLLYICFIKYSNNTAFLKLKRLCGMRPCDQTQQSRACALRTRGRVEYLRAEYQRAERKDRESDREHS